MVAFIVLGIIVIAAGSVLATILIGRSQSHEVASPTNPTVSAIQPSVPPAPPAPPGTFTTLGAPATQQCAGHGRKSTTDLQVAWAASDATAVWIASGTEDAATSGGQQVPISGNQDSIPTPLELDCTAPSMTFTLTLIGDDGAHVSRTLTVAVVDRHR
jgi:hypothetical protein